MSLDIKHPLLKQKKKKKSYSCYVKIAASKYDFNSTCQIGY